MDTIILNTLLFETLSTEAKESERLRMHFDLRTTDKDGSQRMLNAVEPGTMMPVHRHLDTTETVIVLRGCIKENFFDDDMNLIESHILKAGSDKIGVCVPVGVWHNLESLEAGSMIFSAKDGSYHPLHTDEIYNIQD